MLQRSFFELVKVAISIGNNYATGYGPGLLTVPLQ
jgi:hypothetical protein